MARAAGRLAVGLLARAALCAGACPPQPEFASLDESSGLLNFACGRSWAVDLVADADCGARCHPRYTHGPHAGEVHLFREPVVVQREYVHAYCDVWPTGRAEQVFARPVERAAVRARAEAAADERRSHAAPAVANASAPAGADGDAEGAPDFVLLLFEGLPAELLEVALPRTLAQLRADVRAGAGAGLGSEEIGNEGGARAHATAAEAELWSFSMLAGDGDGESPAADGWRALLGDGGEAAAGGRSVLCALQNGGYIAALAADRCTSPALDAAGVTVEAAIELAAAVAAEARGAHSAAVNGFGAARAPGGCIDHLLLEHVCAAALQLAARARAPRLSLIHI